MRKVYNSIYHKLIEKNKIQHNRSISDYIGNIRPDNALMMYKILSQIDLKTKNFIIIPEIYLLVEKNNHVISVDEVIDFLSKISLTYDEDIFYINMDLLRRATHRLEQHLELKGLEDNKRVLNNNLEEKEITTRNLFEEIQALENKNEELFFIVKNISKEHENLFDDVINYYNKIIDSNENNSGNNVGNQNFFDSIKLGIEDVKIKIKDLELYNKKLEETQITKSVIMNKLSEKIITMEANLKFFNDYYERMEENQKSDTIITKLVNENEKLKEEINNLEKNYEEIEKNLKEKIIENVELKDLNTCHLLEIDRLRMQQKNETYYKLEQTMKENEKQLNNEKNETAEEKESSNPFTRVRKNHSMTLSNPEILDPLYLRNSEPSTTSMNTEYQKLLIYTKGMEKINSNLEEKVNALNYSFQNQTKKLYDQNNEIKNLRNQLIMLESKYSHIDPKTNVFDFQEKSWFKRYRTVYKKQRLSSDDKNDEIDNLAYSPNRKESHKKYQYVETLEDYMGEDEDLFSGENDHVQTDSAFVSKLYSNPEKLNRINSSQRIQEKVASLDDSDKVTKNQPSDRLDQSKLTIPVTSELTLNFNSESNIKPKISASNVVMERTQTQLQLLNPKKELKNADHCILKTSSINITQTQDNFSFQATKKQEKHVKIELPPEKKQEEDEFENIASAVVQRKRILTQISKGKTKLNNRLANLKEKNNDGKSSKLFDIKDEESEGEVSVVEKKKTKGKDNKKENTLSLTTSKDHPLNNNSNNVNRDCSILNNYPNEESCKSPFESNQSANVSNHERIISVNTQRINNIVFNENDFKKNFNFISHRNSVFVKVLKNNYTGFIFTDNVFLYESPNVRTKEYYDILITTFNIFIIHSEKNIVQNTIMLDHLFRISVSLKNYNLLVK